MTSQKLPKLPTLIRRFRLTQDVLSKKRVPYTRLADKYGVSRRTIYEDVKWINQQINLPLLTKATVEKIVWALNEAEEKGRYDLLLKYGFPFLTRGVTQKIEAETKITEEKKIKIDLNVFTDDEKSILDKAAAILDRKTERKPESIH